VKKSSASRKEIFTGFLFMTPFFILMAVFVIYVLISGVILSLSNARGYSFGSYIGFANFSRLFSDGFFKLTLLNTFLMVLACLVTQVPAAFLLANWINSIPFKKIQGLIQAAFFVPCLMATVIIGILFQMLFTPDPTGLGPDFMNWFLGTLHLPHNFRWLADRDLEFFMVVFVSFWQNVGFESVFFLAFLQSINQDLYEAARMDGARPRHILFHIKIPLMRPALTYVIVTSMVSSFLINELTFVIFPRGPRKGGLTVMNYIFYNLMYNHNMDLAIGAAAGIVIFFIILGVSFLQFPIFGLGKSHEE
jgi:ABC-type sugar transport system permease subunit